MSSSAIQRDSLLNRIYNINEKDFDTVAMDVFRYQFEFNDLYQSYCNLLGFSSLNPISLKEIPFIPIAMFREHELRTGKWTQKAVFKSSGTTSSARSKHLIRDVDWYHQNAEKTFEHLIGSPASFVWIALLPSYMERDDSSLIDMVRYFMHINKRQESDFFPEITPALIDLLRQLSIANQKTILFGVSFALLDLFEKFDFPTWDQLTIIETGGMKGRGHEITRDELHARIKTRHPKLKIASEYGMTELLSQAYMTNDHFQPASTMKILTREITDPLNILSAGRRGGINVVDLANIDTCSFIATDDLGIVYEDGSFDLLGRLDQSDIRGCNLLYE